MGSISNTYITMKCVIIVISLLIVAVPSEGGNKDYPYPKKSNGTHVCKRLEEDDDCDWITNDDFNKEFIDKIFAENQANAEEENIKGLFGKVESSYSGCFPYCQNNGARPYLKKLT